MVSQDHNVNEFTVNYTKYQSQREEELRKNKQLGVLLSVMITAIALILAVLIMYLIYVIYLVVYSRF